MGHWILQYLSALSATVLGHLIPGQSIMMLRMGAVVREIVASCLLRPILMILLPHSINKVRSWSMDNALMPPDPFLIDLVV